MILVSTGHNPTKKGASFEGYTEYDEGCLWTARIISILSVKLPNEDIKYVPTGSLGDKVKFINAQPDVDCVVELHFNSEPSFKAKGSEVLYNKGSEKGKRLSDCIMDEFKSHKIFAPYRGSKEGIHHSGKPLFFLSKTKPVAVILEPEFLFNIDTINLNFEGGCQAIASGITKFVGKDCPNTPKVEFVEAKEETKSVVKEVKPKQGILRRVFGSW